MLDRDASEKIFTDVTQRGIDIGVLINNAGVNTRGFFSQISNEDIRDMAIVNTYPYTILTRALIP